MNKSLQIMEGWRFYRPVSAIKGRGRDGVSDKKNVKKLQAVFSLKATKVPAWRDTRRFLLMLEIFDV